MAGGLGGRNFGGGELGGGWGWVFRWPGYPYCGQKNNYFPGGVVNSGRGQGWFGEGGS